MRLLQIFPVLLATVLPSTLRGETNYKLVCYYGSWATYRTGDGKFTAENIDPKMCTHVVYQYAGLAADNGVAILDTWLSLESGLGDFRKFTNMRNYNKDIKLLIGIGGWNEGSHKYSRMAASPGARSFFVKSIVDFLSTYGFDGLSVDWMYPGSDFNDRANYVSLLKELREAFAPRKWILAIAGSQNEGIIEKGFDVKGISQYVDFVSLLSFDYHGSWDKVTGHNSPLFPRKIDDANYRKLTQQYTIDLWKSKGMDAKKLVLGIPTFGRSFTLMSPDRKNVGSPIVDAGSPGIYTQTAGTLGYNELMEYFKQEKSAWTIEWDDDQKVPFAYRGVFWVSYENEESAKMKAEYIIKQGLGGAMVYALETDDFHGTSGETFPIVKAVRATLLSGDAGSWTPPVNVVVTTSSDGWKPPDRDTNSPPPQPPTSKPVPGDVVCTQTGVLIKDPRDCKHFFTCAPGIGNAINALPGQCPGGLGFNENLQICDYLSNLPNCH